MDFDDLIKSAGRDAIDAFGDDEIYINGLRVEAIFSSEEYSDEAGYRSDTSIELEPSKARYLEKGDRVMVNSHEYKIRHIPEIVENNPLILIGLKRA